MEDAFADLANTIFPNGASESGVALLGKLLRNHSDLPLTGDTTAILRALGWLPAINPSQKGSFSRTVTTGNQQMLTIKQIETERRQATGNCGITCSYRYSGARSRLLKLESQLVATGFAYFLAAKAFTSFIVISHSPLRGSSGAICKKLFGFTLSASQAHSPASYLASFLTVFSQ